MVDELLNQKNGYDISSTQTASSSEHQLDYIKRDDNSIGRMSDSTSDGSINSLVNICDFLFTRRLIFRLSFKNEMKHINRRASGPVKSKIKKISTSVFFKNGKESVQNEAFENIGDDDL